MQHFVIKCCIPEPCKKRTSTSRWELAHMRLVEVLFLQGEALNEISCRPNINRIGMKWQTAAYELPWFRNCAALQEISNNDFRILLPDIFLFWTFPDLICPFMSKNPAAFRSSLPDSFLFWTFPGLIIHLYPKNQLLSVVHCLTASCFGLFLA